MRFVMLMGFFLVRGPSSVETSQRSLYLSPKWQGTWDVLGSRLLSYRVVLIRLD